MYLMEGTSGNNDGTTGEAYMTVYDFEGRIVQSRTKVRAVSDLKALTEAGITESGYIESEGVKSGAGNSFWDSPRNRKRTATDAAPIFFQLRTSLTQTARSRISHDFSERFSKKMKESDRYD